MSFVGNAGGYLGLFLGYALLNLPDFLQDAYNWINGKRKETPKFRIARPNGTVWNEDGKFEEKRNLRKWEQLFVYISSIIQSYIAWFQKNSYLLTLHDFELIYILELGNQYETNINSCNISNTIWWYDIYFIYLYSILTANISRIFCICVRILKQLMFLDFSETWYEEVTKDYIVHCRAKHGFCVCLF